MTNPHANGASKIAAASVPHGAAEPAATVVMRLVLPGSSNRGTRRPPLSAPHPDHVTAALLAAVLRAQQGNGRDQQGHPEPPVAPLSSHRWQSCGRDAPSPAHSVLFLSSHSELARIF